MTFEQANKKIQEQFEKLAKTGKLFRVNISGKDLWNIYLDSFETHPIWRVNSVHNCDNDRHFFERYANIVAIIDNKIVSLFDFEAEGEYKKSIAALSAKIKTCQINSIFIESYDELSSMGNGVVRRSLTRNQATYRLGNEKSLKQYTVDDAMGKEVGKVYTFYHFNVLLPKQFVDFSSKSSGAILGDLNTTRQLFEKGLNIPLDTLELVRDLIQQGSLLRGDMYLVKVLEFIKLKKQFEQIPVAERNSWLWLNFQSVPYARFANELIGTTCIELAEGKEINAVCKDFNIRVDPTNYNKAKSPVTKAMIELAEKTIVELGYENSFERRFATIEDIDISEIKHSNINNTIDKPVGLFGQAGVTVQANSRHKRAEFDKIETVSIDKFMQDILPNTQSLEVFLENKFESHLVSLFTAKDKTVKNLFKWSNPFSWTYNGNLSGKSMIKENVKAAGGKTTGVLRCSLQWNDEDTKGIVDLDLHCVVSNNAHIYYGNKRDLSTTTWLDVDMINPTKIGIENITVDRFVKDGTYKFYIRNYSQHRSFKGFKAEIEVDGNVYNYYVPNAFIENQGVATVTVKQGVISIVHHLPETFSAKNLWGLETNQFHKVNLVCESPNHWGDNKIGTKEYFFMLQGCKTPDATRAFHVDQLNSELMSVRKAIDLLGNYKMVEPSDKQLSGIGFNCTQRDELVVRVTGSHKRLIKIQF